MVFYLLCLPMLGSWCWVATAGRLLQGRPRWAVGTGQLALTGQQVLFWGYGRLGFANTLVFIRIFWGVDGLVLQKLKCCLGFVVFGRLALQKLMLVGIVGLVGVLSMQAE